MADKTKQLSPPPILGIVPHDKDLEDLRLASLSAGAKPTSLYDEFMRPGAKELEGFVDTANPVNQLSNEKLRLEYLAEGVILRKGVVSILVSYEELTDIKKGVDI